MTYRHRLATVRVPVAPGIPDIALDLQAAFDRCYDGLAFDREIDYSKKPPIPLPSETRQWIDSLLRREGPSRLSFSHFYILMRSGRGKRLEWVIFTKDNVLSVQIREPIFSIR